MTDNLLRQREAAALLGVSVAYLRASECPKVLLPGNGPKGKPLVRYRQSDLRTWADQHARKPSVIRRRKAS
jgi:predicted DNA-binding transcriptional regulator AlpA